MTNKFLAAGSVALMGAGALAGATPAQAVTLADCGTAPSNAFLSLQGDDVCSLTMYIASGSWTGPTGVDRIAAVVIGAGGGSVSVDGQGYAGGGGEILYVEDVDTADLATMEFGIGGTSGYSYGAAGNGDDTVLGTAIARGGMGGTDSMDSGWSGNGNTSWASGSVPSNGVFGGGASSNASDFAPGAGYTFDDPDLTESDPLFTVASSPEFGRGGSPDALEEVTYWGSGASANASEAFAAGNGAIIFRWIPAGADSGSGDEELLASTGVDAAPMGIAAAGMLVAGGVGLAIARRARRSK